MNFAIYQHNLKNKAASMQQPANKKHAKKGMDNLSN